MSDEISSDITLFVTSIPSNIDGGEEAVRDHQITASLTDTSRRALWDVTPFVNILWLSKIDSHSGKWIFKFISLYECYCIYIQISLKFV